MGLPFLLNSLLFVLIGLQLPNILEGLSGEYSTTSVLLYVALVSLAVIGTRLLWTFPMAYLPRYLSRSLRERDPYPSWQGVTVLAYTGMMGAVSLAAALAIPLTIQGGASFPGRDLILFITFCVILVTLVPQGLSLPFIVRRLGLAGAEDDEHEEEEVEARLRAAEAALEKIEELEDEDWVSEDMVERMREFYEFRRRRFAARLDGHPENAGGDDPEERSQTYQRLRRELLGAEREALLQLRNQGRLSDEVRRRVEQDLDLEDTRLEI